MRLEATQDCKDNFVEETMIISTMWKAPCNIFHNDDLFPLHYKNIVTQTLIYQYHLVQIYWVVNPFTNRVKLL